MVNIKKTREADIPFIVSCLDGKDEDFAGQCGYGNRYFTYPVTPEQISAFQKEREIGPRFFTIYNNGERIGSLELIVDTKKEECSVARFLIADEFRGKGYGTTALKQAAEYAFRETGVCKVRLTVFDFNAGARRCYEKAGFTETSRKTRDNGWVACR